MTTRLPNLLHDLASEIPVDVEAGLRPTLRRARIRRGVTAGAAGLAVVALIVSSLSAIDLLSRPTTPAVTGPNPRPAGFAGLWPETDAEALAVTQAAVDEGHNPLQASPEGITSLLAVNVLGWDPGDDQVEHIEVRGSEAEVVIGNRTFGDPVPPVTIEARQLGRNGPRGVWSVVDVSTSLIRLDPVAEIAPGVIGISGSVADRYDGAPLMEANVFDGPKAEPSLGSARYELTDRTFAFEIHVSPTPDGRATLLLTMPDAVGASLGAVMVPVPTQVGEPAPPWGPNLEGVPPDVAVTAQRVYDAALAGDVDALAPLLDPNTFAFNFDDGSDPIPAWRADPSVLDLMAAVLQLPAAEPRTIQGYGTLTIWPYLIDSDFDTLTKREADDLQALGYSTADIQLMIDGGNGYQGPRLAIDETGLWRSFTTMGE
jgi:hypothetical protein